MDPVCANIESPDEPLEPELPDVPLDPDVPLVPAVPDEPPEPDVPLDPELPAVPDEPLDPLEPEDPLVPDEPLVPLVPDVPDVIAENETPFIINVPFVLIEPVTSISFPKTTLVAPELVILFPSCTCNVPLTEIKPAVGSNNISPPPEDFNSTSPSTVCKIILSLPVLLYSSNSYFISAWNGIKRKVINIDIPISLGILVLFCELIK
mgnify:CR=1 FL=1